MIEKRKLDALTSLRFFAAAMIVLTHAHNIFGSFGIANAAPLGQGVSFFFVLSGFILAYNYPDVSKKGAIARFFVARFARVWPLHLFTCVLWIGLIFHFDRAAYFGGIRGVGTLIANLGLIQSWFPYKAMSLSFNGVAWSISNEMYFYLLFPMLIAAWARHWARIMFCLAGVVAVFIVLGNMLKLQSTDDYYGVSLLGTIYFNPLVRVFEFAFGIGLAKIFMSPGVHNVQLSKSGWLFAEICAITFITTSMILAGDPNRIAAYFGPASAYYFQREGLWFIWGVLILTFALSKGPVAGLLSRRPMTFLGEISFALYLVHAIIITFLDEYIEKVQSYGGLGYAAFWITAVLSATLLFKGVEDPCRKLIMNAWDKKQKFKDSIKSSYTPLAVGCLILLVIGFGIVHLNRPSTLAVLSTTEIDEMGINQASIDGAQGTFSNGISVLRLKLTPASDGTHTNGELFLKNARELTLKETIAIHLNDSAGTIISKAGDSALDKLKAKLPANTVWRYKFTVRNDELKAAATIGIAMYVTPAELIAVEAKNTDWDGKRLIITHFQSQLP